MTKDKQKPSVVLFFTFNILIWHKKYKGINHTSIGYFIIKST